MEIKAYLGLLEDFYRIFPKWGFRNILQQQKFFKYLKIEINDIRD